MSICIRSEAYRCWDDLTYRKSTQKHIGHENLQVFNGSWENSTEYHQIIKKDVQELCQNRSVYLYDKSNFPLTTETYGQMNSKESLLLKKSYITHIVWEVLRKTVFQQCSKGRLMEHLCNKKVQWSAESTATSFIYLLKWSWSIFKSKFVDFNRF